MSTTKPARSGRPWAYVGSLTGGAVSIAANVAHTYMPPAGTPAGAVYHPHSFAVVVAVFWPFAVFIAIEILARIDWPTATSSTVLRMAGFVPLALVAAVVSYRHLSALLKFYGEDTVTYVIGPLAVDGLMVMSTGALIVTGVKRAAQAIAEAVQSATGDREDTAPDVTGETPGPDTGAPERAPKRPAAKRPAAKRPAKPSGVRSDGAVTKAAVAELMSANPQMSTGDMATALNISDRTVRRHVASITAPA